jgi:hypothetical protein
MKGEKKAQTTNKSEYDFWSYIRRGAELFDEKNLEAFRDETLGKFDSPHFAELKKDIEKKVRNSAL